MARFVPLCIADVDHILKYEHGYFKVRENVTGWSGGVLFENPFYGETMVIFHVNDTWRCVFGNVFGEIRKLDERHKKLRELAEIRGGLMRRNLDHIVTKEEAKRTFERISFELGKDSDTAPVVEEWD